MVQCRCTQAFVVISRYGGGLAVQRSRNKARFVIDSCCTGKWRKKHMVYPFMDKSLPLIMYFRGMPTSRRSLVSQVLGGEAYVSVYGFCHCFAVLLWRGGGKCRNHIQLLLDLLLCGIPGTWQLLLCGTSSLVVWYPDERPNARNKNSLLSLQPHVPHFQNNYQGTSY